ncbi:FHA domain-containing protein [Kitasatospora cinereorecta]|uniref:FHA domain-containing protein n=1 Tax=Kitasatospora cinereorecta TaxID=285560 RepID=A0ABW0V8V6_9ACTN
MPICPRGHESQAEDWCDYCGFPMTPPPGLHIPGTPPPPPAPPAGPAPSHGPMGGAMGGHGGHGGGAMGSHGAPMPQQAPMPQHPPVPDMTAGLVTCPICRTPQTGRYCEECGYDFDLAPQAPRAHSPGHGGYGFPPPAQPAQPGPVPHSQVPHSQVPHGQVPPMPGHGAGMPPTQMPPAPMPPAPMPPAPGAPGGHGGHGAPGGHGGLGAPGMHGAPAAPAPPGPPPAPMSFDKSPFEPGQAVGFPDGDGFERTGPVYAAPGDSFGTSFRLAPPGEAGQQTPQAPPAPPVRATWIAVVSADRDYFTDMMARSGPEAAGLFFPPYCPERRIPLTGRGQLRIGRRSQHRGTVPEIDLSVPPEDPGASHQHALLAEQADGSWVLVDQDSTNGTTVNGGADAVPPHTAIPLADGDRIHVGAWTTITLYRS